MKDYEEQLKKFAEKIPGATISECLEFMKIQRLDCIADALEGINQELSCIAGHLEYLCEKEHPLDECISKTRTGSFLCVTGHVTTKNY